MEKHEARPMETPEVADPQLEPGRPPEVQLTFWQHPLVQNLLPLITSVAFHISILVVGALLFTVHTVFVQERVSREQVIIPESAYVENAPVGGIPNPGLGGDPNLAAAQAVDPKVSVSDSWADRRSETLTATLMGGAAPDAADSVIGLGLRTGLAGTGKTGSGGTANAGGELAPLGPPGGGMGLGPKSPFMGISGNAKRVAYICDGSGSMMDVFWRVRTELRKAVDVLRPIQAFNVIFFSDIDVAALNKTSLVMATPENKRKAFELSENMAAAGSTNPMPAIRMAFQQKPELIYVLTDGFENVVSYDEVINEFRRLNVDKKIKVNLILIRSSSNPELERVVRIIAAENGGICKIIERQDL